MLNAFREVEDNPAGLRILADQTRTQDEAVRSATHAAQLRVASQLQGERARAAVGLIRALGGGWDHPAEAINTSDAGPVQPLHARHH